METKGQIPSGVIRVSFEEMEREFRRILNNLGFQPDDALRCAQVFAENTLDGVNSHGVNRFPRFVQYIRDGRIRVDAKPQKKHRAGAIEQWDGCLGPGPLNALFATDRAMELSKESGLGCVGLANTNHWMRGGHYGWKAAKAGFLFIGWTNTTANMPAWGAVDARLGNNPLVIGVPFRGEAIVLDMAMSQFSYGSVESHQIKSSSLPLHGGYDRAGALTTDPAEILETKRLLPMGYWKGSGLALMLDVLAVILSGGLSTAEISSHDGEFAVSQVFLAIDISQLSNHQEIQKSVTEIIKDVKQSVPVDKVREVMYPGERVMRTRIENQRNGIPVDRTIWEEVKNL